MGRLWLLALVAGCYSPHPPAGSPCTAGAPCPAPLVCATTTETCEPAAGASDAAHDSAPGGDTPGARDGGGIDSSPASCLAAWHAGPPQLSAPVALAELESPNDEIDPWLTRDELTIFFASGMTADLYTSTRANRLAPFAKPSLAANLNSTAADVRVSMTANGDIAVLSSNRNSNDDFDLFQAVREDDTDVFGTPSAALFGTINTAHKELDPELSADGLTLYYSEIGAGGAQVIAVATRNTTSAEFGTPTLVQITGGPSVEADPTLSADGTVLVYSTITGSPANADLVLAIRPLPSGAFTYVGPLAVDTSANEGDGYLSADACRLYFSSDRAGGAGRRDLYVTSVMP